MMAMPGCKPVPTTTAGLKEEVRIFITGLLDMGNKK